jgi:prevent-host-death family protein
MSVKVPVSEAKAQLTELVRLAQSGEEVVLTRFGKEAVRLTPVAPSPSREDRRAILDAVRASARSRPSPGPAADRSQDFLYDSDGLPA